MCPSCFPPHRLPCSQEKPTMQMLRSLFQLQIICTTPQFICQYCKCQPITALEGNLLWLQSDVYISIEWSKMFKVLAGFKWSVLSCFRERFCLESLEWFGRVVDLLKELLFLYLHLQELLHLGIYSSRYLKEKRKNKTWREWVSFQHIEVWNGGESLIDSGGSKLDKGLWCQGL